MTQAYILKGGRYVKNPRFEAIRVGRTPGIISFPELKRAIRRAGL